MRVVRTSVEATVLLTGVILGGTIGIGTLTYALLIGPITHVTIPALAITRSDDPKGARPLGSTSDRQSSRPPEAPHAVQSEHAPLRDT